MRFHPTALSAVLVALASGCLQITTGTGTDAGSASVGDATPQTSSSPTTGEPAPSGSGCATEPGTSIVLCQAISTCPGLTVDPDAYPNCGFRLYGASPFDLECICDNALCPIGAATSCADANQLLGAENVLLVCAQVDEARCLPFASAATDAGAQSGSAPAGGGGSGSPCASCAAQCGSTPECFEACGC